MDISMSLRLNYLRLKKIKETYYEN